MAADTLGTKCLELRHPMTHNRLQGHPDWLAGMMLKEDWGWTEMMACKEERAWWGMVSEGIVREGWVGVMGRMAVEVVDNLGRGHRK